MTLISLPAQGSTAWYTWAQSLQSAVGTPTVTVSAVDSANPTRADFVCDGTGDEVTVQAAIDTASAIGGRVLLRAGEYNFAGQVALPPKVGIIGEGVPATTIRFSGTAGGRVITTAAFTSTTQAAWTGGLRDFRIVYPLAKITAATKVVYLAQPFAPVDISIVSESASESFVSGSVGIDLDGCSNPGAMTVNAVVQAQFESAVKVRANHVTIFGQGAYCGSFVDVDADSLDSVAGPPYNVNVLGFHSFHSGVAGIRIRRAHSVHVYSGLNESPGGAPDMRCESTFTSGEASIREVSNFGSSRLVHYGVGGVVHVESTQNRERARYTGQASGTPVDLSAWQDLTLQNGWLDYGSGFVDAQYRKTIDGEVELRGFIKSGTTTAGTVLAQLNVANYRPPGTLVFIVRTGGTHGEVRVDVDGSLILMSGSATELSLAGIRWTPNH